MDKENHLSPALQDAVRLVYELHARDARKGSQVPVLAHLLGVCALVQHDGGNEIEAIAAMLHDTLEDRPEEITPDAIRARFGSDVLDLVRVATDTPGGYPGGEKPPWRERKEKYLVHVCSTPPSKLRVTVADKVDNVRALLSDYRRLGEALWARFNAGREDQLWYYRAVVDAYRNAGFSGQLLVELDRLVTELEAACRQGEQR